MTANRKFVRLFCMELLFSRDMKRILIVFTYILLIFNQSELNLGSVQSENLKNIHVLFDILFICCVYKMHLQIENSIPNLVKSNEIWIVITIFR